MADIIFLRLEFECPNCKTTLTSFFDSTGKKPCPACGKVWALPTTISEVE